MCCFFNNRCRPCCCRPCFPMGAMGPRGFDGPMGFNGPRGFDGPRGYDGPMGFDGPVDSDGQMGPMGPVGPICPPCPPCPPPRPIVRNMLRVLNSGSQAGATAAANVALGARVFESGRAITYTLPNTINLVPGLYRVYYAGNYTGAAIGNSGSFQALIDGVAVPGSFTSAVSLVTGDSIPFANEFYVSASSNLPLVFQKTTTAAGDAIENFTVTVEMIS